MKRLSIKDYLRPRQWISFFTLIAFFCNALGPLPAAYAQAVFPLPSSGINLPAPGTMIPPSPAYFPPQLIGMTVLPDQPFQFEFFVDSGEQDLKEEELRVESMKLIKYFMAALTVPENELWVNLSPYEKDRIIPEDFGVTEMGRDLLAQDYILKQLTASLMYPEDELGQEFWQRVYKKAGEKFGIAEIPVDTLNKVWIVPERAKVYVNADQGQVFVVDSYLKVMLEEDYLSRSSSLVARGSLNGQEPMERDTSHPGLATADAGAGDSRVTTVTKEIIREILIPQLEREVNEGKNFANLRQIYHALILAEWYKRNLKQSILAQIYVGKNKVNGIDIDDKQISQKIYQQYLAAFKKGVYDFIKEEYDPLTQEIVPRKYFAGGFDTAALGGIFDETTDTPTQPGDLAHGRVSKIGAGVQPNKGTSSITNRRPQNGQRRLSDFPFKPLDQALFDVDEVPEYILDLDGVILENAGLISRHFGFVYAMIKAGIFKSEGFVPDEKEVQEGGEYFMKRLGNPSRDGFRELIKRLAGEGSLKFTQDIDFLVQHFYDLYVLRRDAEIKEILTLPLEEARAQLLRPGVIEFLENKKAQGKRLQVVSAAPGKARWPILKRLKLVEYFDRIQFADTVKEKLDSIEEIIEENQVAGRTTIYIDDSPNVVKEAKTRFREMSYGVEFWIVGYPNTIEHAEIMDNQADYLVPDLRGLIKGGLGVDETEEESATERTTSPAASSAKGGTSAIRKKKETGQTRGKKKGDLPFAVALPLSGDEFSALADGVEREQWFIDAHADVLYHHLIHSQSVPRLMYVMAKRLGLPEELAKFLYRMALLHDVHPGRDKNTRPRVPDTNKLFDRDFDPDNPYTLSGDKDSVTRRLFTPSEFHFAKDAETELQLRFMIAKAFNLRSQFPFDDNLSDLYPDKSPRRQYEEILDQIVVLDPSGKALKFTLEFAPLFSEYADKVNYLMLFDFDLYLQKLFDLHTELTAEGALLIKEDFVAGSYQSFNSTIGTAENFAIDTDINNKYAARVPEGIRPPLLRDEMLHVLAGDIVDNFRNIMEASRVMNETYLRTKRLNAATQAGRKRYYRSSRRSSMTARKDGRGAESRMTAGQPRHSGDESPKAIDTNDKMNVRLPETLQRNGFHTLAGNSNELQSRIRQILESQELGRYFRVIKTDINDWSDLLKFYLGYEAVLNNNQKVRDEATRILENSHLSGYSKTRPNLPALLAPARFMQWFHAHSEDGIPMEWEPRKDGLVDRQQRRAFDEMFDGQDKIEITISFDPDYHSNGELRFVARPTGPWKTKFSSPLKYLLRSKNSALADDHMLDEQSPPFGSLGQVLVTFQEVEVTLPNSPSPIKRHAIVVDEIQQRVGYNNNPNTLRIQMDRWRDAILLELEEFSRANSLLLLADWHPRLQRLGKDQLRTNYENPMRRLGWQKISSLESPPRIKNRRQGWEGASEDLLLSPATMEALSASLPSVDTKASAVAKMSSATSPMTVGRSSIRRLPQQGPFKGKITLGITGTETRSELLDHPIAGYVDGKKEGQIVTVVDLGVSSGKTTAETAKKFQGRADVTGVDLNMPDYTLEFDLPSTRDDGFDGRHVAFFEIQKTPSGQMEHKLTFVARTEDREYGGLTLYYVVPDTQINLVKFKAEEMRDSLMRKAIGDDFLRREHFADEADFSDGNSTLSFDPVRRLAKGISNLRFVKSGFELSAVEGKVDIIRAGNVFSYYEKEEVDEAMQLLGEKLKEGGILIVATNETNYLLFDKVGDRLLPRTLTVRLNTTEDPVFHRKQIPAFSELYTNVEKIVKEELITVFKGVWPPVGDEWITPQYAEKVVQRLRDLGYQVSLDEQGYAQIRLGDEFQPGGIDLNPSKLDIKVDGGDMNIKLPEGFEGIDLNSIDGFIPVIFHITPVPNFPLLLGIKEDEEEVEQLSRLVSPWVPRNHYAISGGQDIIFDNLKWHLKIANMYITRFFSTLGLG